MGLGKSKVKGLGWSAIYLPTNSRKTVVLPRVLRTLRVLTRRDPPILLNGACNVLPIH